MPTPEVLAEFPRPVTDTTASAAAEAPGPRTPSVRDDGPGGTVLHDGRALEPSAGGHDAPSGPVGHDTTTDAGGHKAPGSAPDGTTDGGGDGSGGAEPPTGPGGGAEARKPLPDISDLQHLRDSGAIDAWAHAVADRHGTLTPDEVRAIYRYTTDVGYDEMNSLLGGIGHFSPEDAARIQRDIDNAISGLSKISPVTGEVVRGTNLPLSVLDQVRVGQRFPDPAFLSSTRLRSVADSFRSGGNAMIYIDGRTGVDVQALSRYGREAEVLFSPGANLEVVRLEQSVDGSYWNIYLEER